MINSTSESLKDSVPKVGFRLMAFNGFARAIGLREHKNYNHMTAHVIVDSLCSERFISLCTVANIKAKLHLMLRPYYTQLQ